MAYAALSTAPAAAAITARAAAGSYKTMVVTTFVLAVAALIATSADLVGSSRTASPNPTQGSALRAPGTDTRAIPNIAAEVAADDSKFTRLTEMGKQQLAAVLRDPGSAEYRDVAAYSPSAAKGGVTFCGYVNAKNAFGGYGGYERFIAAPNVGAWLQTSPGIRFASVWRDICRPDARIGAAGF
jgi:hypothetical protein